MLCSNELLGIEHFSLTKSWELMGIILFFLFVAMRGIVVGFEKSLEADHLPLCYENVVRGLTPKGCRRLLQNDICHLGG